MAARGKSVAFARIRAEVIRIVALIPAGKFTTYGSIAIHMNVIARHVATVLARLTPEESTTLPWHRVVAADARISPNMDPSLARKQRRLLKAEGLRIQQAYVSLKSLYWRAIAEGHEDEANRILEENKDVIENVKKQPGKGAIAR